MPDFNESPLENFYARVKQQQFVVNKYMKPVGLQPYYKPNNELDEAARMYEQRLVKYKKESLKEAKDQIDK